MGVLVGAVGVVAIALAVQCCYMHASTSRRIRALARSLKDDCCSFAIPLQPIPELPLDATVKKLRGAGLTHDMRTVRGMLVGPVEQICRSAYMAVLRQDHRYLCMEHMELQLPAGADIVFVPNQELLGAKDIDALIDARQHAKRTTVLCKTKHAMDVFHNMAELDARLRHVNVEYAPFPHVAGPGARPPSITSRRCFLHAAGKSWMKNTKPVLDAWYAHPEWPPLVVTCGASCMRPWRNDGISMFKYLRCSNIFAAWQPLPYDILRDVQQCAGFLIMPSACEGFGYVLHEAHLHGNVLVTIDAPPMNESCTNGNDCILIPHHESIPTHEYNFAWMSKLASKAGAACFTVTADSVAAAVQQCLSMSRQEHADMVRRSYHAWCARHTARWHAWRSALHKLGWRVVNA